VWCLQIAKTLAEVVSKYAQVVLDGCAYAGTGNVLKVQELLALCGEHIETEEATAWKVGVGFSHSFEVNPYEV
jgi:26S proteasome regulatory subunit N1